MEKAIIEVMISVKGDHGLSEKEAKSMADEIGGAIRAIVERRMDNDDAVVEAKMQATADEPLFTGRHEGILEILEAAGAPPNVLEAVRAGGPAIDRYGATNGCDCDTCKAKRHKNALMPMYLFTLETLTMETPALDLPGAYVLTENEFNQLVPKDIRKVILEYLSFNEQWDTDGKSFYYRPVPDSV